MEKLIVLPVKDSPIINSDSINILNNSIIIVYEKDNVIGSVIYDSDNEEFLLSTIYKADYYVKMTNILEENTNFTFKYITQD